jgi:hypothetical protein
MERRKATTIFAAAAECFGSHDDWPIMPKGIDPMSCVSRNRVAQPFFLTSEHDQVIVLFAGRTKVELPGSQTPTMELRPGESLYIPAGQSSRIVPVTESVQLKWRAEPGGWEAASWFCPKCWQEVFSREFDTGTELPQQCYWNVCQEFNSDPRLRTCTTCGIVCDPVDLSDIRWSDVARALREADARADS